MLRERRKIETTFWQECLSFLETSQSDHFNHTRLAALVRDLLPEQVLPQDQATASRVALALGVDLPNSNASIVNEAIQEDIPGQLNRLLGACAADDLPTVKILHRNSRLDLSTCHKGSNKLSALMTATQARAGLVVVYLLGQGVRVEENSPGQDSLLHTWLSSTYRRELDPVVDELASRSLIERCHGVNSTGSQGRTPLHLCIVNNDTSNFVLLLNRGADIHAVDENGNTCLQLVAQYDRFEIYPVLQERLSDVQFQAQVHMLNRDGLMPLAIAAQHGACNVFKLLADHNASLSWKSSDGSNLLHFAALGVEYSTATLVLLCHSGLDFSNPNKSGETAMHKLAYNVGSRAFDREDLETVKTAISMIKEQGIDMDASTALGVTPLHILATRMVEKINQSAQNKEPWRWYENKQTLKIFLDAGADPYTMDKAKLSSFDILVDAIPINPRWAEDVILLTLETFPLDDVINRQYQDTTLFRMPAMCGCDRLCMRMIQSSPDVDLAIRNSSLPHMLSPMEWICYYACSQDVFREAVRHCQDLCATGRGGLTLLHYACGLRCEQSMEPKEYDFIIETLISCGIDVNSRTVDQHGNTALIVAAAIGRLNAVKSLVNLGADPAIQNLDGYSALYAGCEGGHTNIVKYLVESRTEEDRWSITLPFDLIPKKFVSLGPLEVAALRGHQELVEYLLSRDWKCLRTQRS